MSTMFDPGDEMDPYFEAIGRVVVASGYLEDCVSALYAAMLGARKDVSALVASGMPFGSIVDACRAIRRVTDLPTDGAGFGRVLGRAAEQYEQRNHVVHGTWFGIAGGEARATLRSRRLRVEATERRWTVESLHGLARSIGETAAHLFELEQTITD